MHTQCGTIRRTLSTQQGRTIMNKWIIEDWGFDVEIIDGEAKHCRLGLEKGDKFHFAYGTPQNFCPCALAEIFTWCEVIRFGGNFTYRGAKEKIQPPVLRYKAGGFLFVPLFLKNAVTKN